MELSKKSIALSGAVLLVVGVVLWLVFALGASAPDDGVSNAGGASAAGAVGGRTRKHVSQRIHEKGRRHRDGVAAERRRPDLLSEFSRDEIDGLPEEFRKIFEELQAALDADDWKRTVKIVQRMQDSAEWPDGIPSVLHHAAIEMLKWFGSHTAPELVGYLGSTDSEVVESATEAMLDVLGDFSLSDRDRSALLLGYIKVIRDADMLDMMMFELNNMRPTVRAETALGIWGSENDAARSVLQEGLDFFFGDADGYEVKGHEDIQRYLDDAERTYANDPDLAESDEDFYGGDKDAE